MAGYVWWSFHPVDSIIDSLLLIHYSSVYFFRLFFTSFGVAGGLPMILLCAVCSARILWNHLGFLGITCDFEFGTGKRRLLGLLGLLRMLAVYIGREWYRYATLSLFLPALHCFMCVMCRGGAPLQMSTLVNLTQVVLDDTLDSLVFSLRCLWPLLVTHCLTSTYVAYR